MPEWKHQEYAIGYAVEPLRAGDMVETYRRSWRERLLSWPWRPWITTAVRKSSLATMMELREQAEADMRAITGINDLMR